MARSAPAGRDSVFKKLARRLLICKKTPMEMFKGYDPGKFYD